MKKAIMLGIMLCIASTLAFAQEATTSVTIKGVIIDNMCAGSQKPENLEAFVRTHTKECALLPSCVASGYSIFSEGKLMKFDSKSNTKIEEFLKNPDSKLQVVAVVNKFGDLLSLVSIENQK